LEDASTKEGKTHMAAIEARLAELGLELPKLAPPPGGKISMRSARRHNGVLYLSGNGPMLDGKPVYQGKLGATISIEEGYAAARLTALNLLAVMRSELGDLDRVALFIKSIGFINSAPGFNQQPAVLNGFSDLIMELYGEERGLHARSAVGMAELPWDIPVEIETIVAITE
jgi:enamine deaminase RidA (YjgF/YER057c/UK114 family)